MYVSSTSLFDLPPLIHRSKGALEHPSPAQQGPWYSLQESIKGTLNKFDSLHAPSDPNDSTLMVTAQFNEALPEGLKGLKQSPNGSKCLEEDGRGGGPASPLRKPHHGPCETRTVQIEGRRLWHALPLQASMYKQNQHDGPATQLKALNTRDLWCTFPRPENMSGQGKWLVLCHRLLFCHMTDREGDRRQYEPILLGAISKHTRPFGTCVKENLKTTPISGGK